MCIITKNPIKIAEQDIPVFKVLEKYDNSSDSCLHAPFNSTFTYNLNYLYKTEIKESNKWLVADMHAYNYLECELEKLNLNKKAGLFSLQSELRFHGYECYGQGFHSLITKERCDIFRGHGAMGSYYVTMECTIPAGSKYIIDGTGCVISNQIIINKVHE